MNGKLPAALRAYRLLSAAATPLAPLFLAQRLNRGKEHRARVGERRGEARFARPNGPLVWVHGASVGELVAALPLIERIAARGFSVLVTSGTVTSGGIAEQRLPRGVIHQFVPLDVPRYVRRFLQHWQPDLALFVESDLWPNMILEASAQGVPMIVVNGRLSENSFRRWRRLPAMIVNLLGRLDLCLAGTPADASRFGELGAPRIVTTGNLKFDVPGLPADRAKLAELRDAIGDRPTDRGGLYPCRRGERGDRGASTAARHFSRAADVDRAAPSRARHRRARVGGRGRFDGRVALARRAARRRDRNLRGRYHGRARPHLPAGAGGLHRRLAGAARRAEPDRGRQARHRHSARAACLEFRRDLCRARRRARRRTGRRRRTAHGRAGGLAE